MAKKKGMSRRIKKRADLAAKELEEKTIENKEIVEYEEKADDELFVLDTAPDAASANLIATQQKKRKAAEEAKLSALNVKQSKRNRISENDERLIKKMMNTHSKKTILSLATAHEERKKQAKRVKRVAGTAKASFDLWDDTAPENEPTKTIAVVSGKKAMAGTAPVEFTTVPKSLLRKDVQQAAKLSNKLRNARRQFEKTAPNSIKVELAQPGQSYRPDDEQHQDAIGEALSIELRRKEAIDYKNEPIGGGQLSEATRALLVNSDDESSSDEEEDMEMTNTRHKRKEKLTRAQRNKQKRAKARQVALDEKKRKKQLMHQYHEAKKVAKEVRKEEAAKIARREEIEALKSEKKAQPLGVNLIEKRSEMDPIYAPSLPVALTDELKDGGLRTVKPKGSLLTDRMESMISRKMANRKVYNKKKAVQGKRRMKGGKGRDFLLA